MAGDSPPADVDPGTDADADADAGPERPSRATVAALRAGIDAVDAVVITFGADGAIREANRTAAAAAGRPAAALAGAPVDAVIADGDRDRFRAAVAEALDAGRATVAVDVPTDADPVPHGFTIVAPDGPAREATTLVAVGRRTGGRGRDRAAVDRMTDAFFSLDRRWHVTYVNERGREVLTRAMGLDRPADVEGRHLWESIPEARETTFFEQYHDAMATQEPTSFESYYEPMDVWFEVTAYPSPSGLSVYFRDVTERRRRREALASHRRALGEMYEVVADRDRTLTEQVRGLLSIGRAELDATYGTLSRVDGDDYAFEVVEAADDGADAPAPPDEGDVIPLSTTNCEVTVADEETVVVDDVAEVPALADRAANAEWGVESYLGAPVFVDGEVYGTFCVHDREARPDGFAEWHVTLVDLMSRWVGTELERRQARERLERQNERLDRFATVVSHDLRSPMNVVAGSLELAADTGDPEHFERARDAVERMDTLVEDVLSLARAGQSIDVDPAVDLATVAERAWTTVDTADATLRVAADDATIRADASRLRQAFANLLRNAVEHGDDAVTVTVDTLTDGAGFYVVDDGPGIPPDERDRVFESGYSAAGGTGLGLAIVREVADAHGWRVDVADAGAGARFEFRGVDGA